MRRPGSEDPHQRQRNYVKLKHLVGGDVPSQICRLHLQGVSDDFWTYSKVLMFFKSPLICLAIFIFLKLYLQECQEIG